MRRKNIAAIAMAAMLTVSLTAGSAANMVLAEELTEETVAAQEVPGEAEPAEEVVEEESAAEAAEEEEMTETEEEPAAEEGDAAADGVAFDETNFPDANFRAKIAQFDTNNDGVFSQAELDAVTSLYVYSNNIADLEGIKNFRKLQNLNCYNNDLEVLDLSGMQELYNVTYDSNENLTTVDFRNCPKLYSAYHAAYQEVVYISAGMTNYIGCQYVDEHTGNIVIDLDGYYTLDADNNKLVDFDTVMSAHLIEVFEFDEHENYDPVTHVLTIPAGEVKTVLQAGLDNHYQPTHWTFFTDLTKVDDCVVSFDSKGGSVVEAQTVEKGSTAEIPEAPVKDGYVLNGWYVDEECTQAYDFASPVNEDITIYAGWTEKISCTLTYDANDGAWDDESSQMTQNLEALGKVTLNAAEPKRAGYLFKGWSLEKDAAVVTEAEFTENHQAITVYAVWEKETEVTPTATPEPTATPTPAPTTVPGPVQTGDSAAVEFWMFGLALSAGLIVTFAVKRKRA